MQDDHRQTGRNFIWRYQHEVLYLSGDKTRHCLLITLNKLLIFSQHI